MMLCIEYPGRQHVQMFDRCEHPSLHIVMWCLLLQDISVHTTFSVTCLVGVTARGHSPLPYISVLQQQTLFTLGCWIQIKLCGGVALLALTFCCRAVLALENSVLRLRWWLGGDWRDEKEWIKHAVTSGVLIHISWQAMKGLREYKVDAWGTNRYHLPVSFYVF